VIQWAHQYDIPPIGRATKVTKDTGAKTLEFSVRLMKSEDYGHDWPTSTPSPENIQAMLESGYIRGSSVGFTSLEWKPIERSEDDESPMGYYSPREHVRQELIELSIVPIPSNPAALAKAMGDGLIVRAHLSGILECVRQVREELNLITRGLGDDLVRVVSDESGAPRPGIEIARPVIRGEALELQAGAEYVTRESLRSIIREELDFAFDRRVAELYDDDLEPQEPGKDSTRAEPRGRRINYQAVCEALHDLPLGGSTKND